jgi:hypothetical protein
LTLIDECSNRRIIGGSSEFGTRDKAVKLSIDPQMLTQSQQVNSLSIVNCDIGDQLSTGNVLSGMPTGLTDLNLRNTRMRAEPSDLSALQNLRSLYVTIMPCNVVGIMGSIFMSLFCFCRKMDQNYMTTFSSRVSLQELTMLYVAKASQQDRIWWLTFRSFCTSDLSDNLLTKFEANLPALESLYVRPDRAVLMVEILTILS